MPGQSERLERVEEPPDADQQQGADGRSAVQSRACQPCIGLYRPEPSIVGQELAGLARPPDLPPPSARASAPGPPRPHPSPCPSPALPKCCLRRPSPSRPDVAGPGRRLAVPGRPGPASCAGRLEPRLPLPRPRRRPGPVSAGTAGGPGRLRAEGTSGGNRTPNPRFWRPVLYQLSYARTGSRARRPPRPARGGARPPADRIGSDPAPDDALSSDDPADAARRRAGRALDFRAVARGRPRVRAARRVAAGPVTRGSW